MAFLGTFHISKPAGNSRGKTSAKCTGFRFLGLRSLAIQAKLVANLRRILAYLHEHRSNSNHGLLKLTCCEELACFGTKFEILSPNLPKSKIFYQCA